MARTARVVAFSTTPEMAEEIDRVARTQGRSRSEVLRTAFEQFAARESNADFGGADLAAEPSAVYSRAPLLAPAGVPALPGLAYVLAHRAEIRALCREMKVRRLWIYGSAVRGDFDAGRSDFDFQVEWEADAPRCEWAGEVFDLQRRLAELLERKVDLGEAGLIKNPYVRAAIEGERLVLYDAEG